MTEAGETERPASLGKMPAQRRSRERVERMLQAAVTVIERDGSDALRMSEVAELAGVSIGSLYQFFPDKAAIVRSLAERITVEGRACIEAELAGVSTMPELRDAFGRLIDIYYGLFLTTPVMRDVWSATQADARLRALELEDSRANAVPLVEALARVRGGPVPPALESAAFLVMQLSEATMRLAISVGREEGDRLVATYKVMALRALDGADG